ncbi:MAG TPA: BACON domain-containing carbohydrate-binding protein [Pyrinomonadaceae bacterium]|jgi:subtilisin-like proprotein convertase family protein
MFKGLFYKSAFILALFATTVLISGAAAENYNRTTAEQSDLTASDGAFTFSNSTPIAINDATIANPYPSSINVSGVRGGIEKLTVTLNNYGHSFPDDADVLLVAPDGRSVVLMSDVGGGFNTSGTVLTFDDSAASALPDSGLIESGTYQPTNFETNDNFPLPAPVQPTGNALSHFNGTNPNGNWSLYVVDDSGQDVGIIFSGWSLTISNGVTAQNTASINIPDSGAASVYPSSINVAGQSGTVTGVRVLINNLTHTAPDDLDLLLVAPGGRRVVLMSDVGGNNAVNNVSLIFDDAVASLLSDDGQIVSGTFKPTNIGGGDSFPLPAPSGNPTGANLSAFNGINPNGAWSLYLVDDSAGNAGVLAGGWSLAINTSTTACPLTINPTIQSFPQTGGVGSFTVSTPAGCDWTARSQAANVVTVASETSGGAGSGTVNFTVLPNTSDPRTGSITVSNNNVTQTFTIQQISGCPFALGQETQSFSATGGLGSVNVTATDACYWTVSSNADWLRITSHPNGVFGASVVTFAVAPNGTNASRTGVITIGGRTLTVTQAAGAGCPYALSADSQYAPFGGAANNFAVLASASCNWTASSSAGWITINSSGGSGNGNVAYTVAANNTNASRTGTITVGNHTVTILQARHPINTPFDFDGDGKTDFSVFRPSNGAWYILSSSDNAATGVQFGLGTDRLVAADYDGDRKTDIAVFRQGFWFVLNSTTNTMRTVNWGTAGDVAAPGDYDGDGLADFAVYRPSQATWYVLQNSSGGIIAQQFGAASDAPVAADYDGDGKTDFALYRAGPLPTEPSIYFIRYSSINRSLVLQFGNGEDLPVSADYDGDGRANIAVFRPSAGAWYRSQDPATNFGEQFWGTANDAPAPGDYDGDGKTDVAVFRQGVWYVLNSSNSLVRGVQWGLNTDLPVPSVYKPNPPQALQRLLP